MKLHLNRADDINLVQIVTAQRLVINHVVYTSSLIVMPQTVISDWQPTQFADLSTDDFIPLAELKPEVVLLGTGERLQFPTPQVTLPLTRHSVGLEVMDTPAACRTYNILASEGRKVAAALLFRATRDGSRRDRS